LLSKASLTFADGREPESWRQFASVMAASLTAHILSNPIVFEKWPHYKGKYAAAYIVVPSPVRAIRVSGESLEPNSPDNDWKRGSVCRCHTSEGSIAVSNTKRVPHPTYDLTIFFQFLKQELGKLTRNSYLASTLAKLVFLVAQRQARKES